MCLTANLSHLTASKKVLAPAWMLKLSSNQPTALTLHAACQIKLCARALNSGPYMIMLPFMECSVQTPTHVAELSHADKEKQQSRAAALRQVLLNGSMLGIQQHLGCSVSAAVARGRAGVLLWGSCVTALWPMEYSASSAASTAAAALLTASAMHAQNVQLHNI